MKTRVHLEATFVLRLGPRLSPSENPSGFSSSQATASPHRNLWVPGQPPQHCPWPPVMQACLTQPWRPSSLEAGTPGKALNEEGLSPAGGRKPSSVPREPKSLPSRWDSGQETGVYRQPLAIGEHHMVVAHGVHLQQSGRLRPQPQLE